MRERPPGLPVLAVAAAVALAAIPGAPAPAAGQSAVETGSGYALLVYESSSGRLAGAATSTLPAGASDGLRMIPGVAGIYAAGRRAAAATAQAADTLRAGLGAESAARAGARGASPLRITLLTPDCQAPDAGSPAFVGPVEVRRGRLPGGCFAAMAVQPGESGGLDRLISTYRETAGRPLPERLTAALEAALGDDGDAGDPAAGDRGRSAALWVTPSAEDGGLRLQVEDHPRPAARLQDQLLTVSARELARSANRLIGAGSYEEAIARADSALDLDPGSVQAWMQKGRAELFAGQRAAAETSFRRMLELDPSALRFLGDPAGPTVNRGVIPYAPRLLVRLDVYRRGYFPTVDFGPPPPGPGDLPADPGARDTARAGTGG